MYWHRYDLNYVPQVSRSHYVTESWYQFHTGALCIDGKPQRVWHISSKYPHNWAITKLQRGKSWNRTVKMHQNDHLDILVLPLLEVVAIAQSFTFVRQTEQAFSTH